MMPKARVLFSTAFIVLLSLKNLSAAVFKTYDSLGLVCKLCVIVDKSFDQYYFNSDEVERYNKLSHVVEYASWVFRSTDWNEDGIEDNIGFAIENIKIGWEPSSNLGNWTTSNLLADFSRQNFQGCCLGVGFTMLKFTDHHAGASYIATLNNGGGICDSETTKSGISRNTILISGAGVTGHKLKLPEITLLLLHELGHSFGVRQHDVNLQDLSCEGFKSKTEKEENVEPPSGRYIMWGQRNLREKGIKANNLRYSACSKQFVVKILTAPGKSGCFQEDFNSFCGNGILESGEECDCGNEINCFRGKCCGSRASTRACQLLVPGISSRRCYLLMYAFKEMESLQPNFAKKRDDHYCLSIIIFNLCACLMNRAILSSYV